MTEAQLVKECLKGNAFAQKRLYETYADKMLGVCHRYTDDRQAAQDMLQDGFIQVFRKLDTFKGDGALEGWIRRVIVNKALEHLRKEKTMRQSSTDLDKHAFMIGEDETVSADMAARDILTVIRKLPKGYRTILNLYAIEGYTHREIAEQLGISEGTSKSQYSRAKSLLQKWLRTEKIVEN